MIQDIVACSLYLHEIPNVFELLTLYSIKLYIDITTSRSFALSTCLFALSTQFLNIVCLLFYAASPAPAPTTVMFPAARIYTIITQT